MHRLYRMAGSIHTIASYNLSWTNGVGIFGGNVDDLKSRPSEYNFIKRAKAPYEFWTNVLQHIHNFIMLANPSVIGLQEVGKATDITDLPIIRANYNHHINVQGPATVVTVWRKDLGEIVAADSSDLGVGSDVGRPISIVFTSQGYLLVNLHSPHRLSSADQQAAISAKLTPFLAREVDKTKIFVMGDFNNKGFSNTSPLVLSTVTLTPGNEREIRSCCFGSRANKLCDYHRGGDYCFGQRNHHPLTIFPSPTDLFGGSVASDHEMVWASYISNPDVPVAKAGGAKKHVRKHKRTMKKRR